jgi:predicted amidohydrolase
VTQSLRIACVQLNSGAEIAPNIVASCALIREAHAQGAEFVATPEVSNLCEMRPGRAAEKAFFEAQEPALQAYRELAAELGIWLLAGSLVVKLEDDPRLANRSLLIDSSGGIVARYDKIHMFDVDLEGGESYRESARFRPGERAVVADSPWGPIGMTICYDMRFAYLYRQLAQAGARILTAPSSFARPTGRAHWHVLLRARAIETGCFMIAPAQCGDHEDGRKTFGHSLVVSPWGEILAEAAEEPGIILADLDLSRVDEARSMVPSLKHDRGFSPAVPLRLAGE